MTHLLPNPKEIRSPSRLTELTDSFMCLLLLSQSISYSLWSCGLEHAMLPLSLGLESPLLLPPRSPSICVAPQGFSYRRCRWLSSQRPVAGRPLTQRKETRKVAVLWELYPQYPGLILSENLSVSRPVCLQTQVLLGFVSHVF